MRFNNGREMLDLLEKDIDLYSPEAETYVFRYNEAGSIAYYSLDKNEARELAVKAKEDGEYWGGLLGPGGYIVDSEEYEYYQEGDETPLDWCNASIDVEWYSTDTYLKEVK